MPAGYSTKCKACNSPNRLQIEAWHEHGDSSRTIAARLRESGEKISDRALDNHFAEHYDVQSEVQEQYAKSQANLQHGACERVTEIQILDDIVAGKHKLHQAIESIIAHRIDAAKKVDIDEDLPRIPGAYAALYAGCVTGICQVLKAKQELLGEDSGSKRTRAMESWVDLMLEEDDNPSDKGAATGSPAKGAG